MADTSFISVRMPDGTVINNIPEGITKAQLESKLRANGVWKTEWDTEPQAPQQEQATPQAMAQEDAKTWRGLAGKALQGATFGFGDEIAAGIGAPIYSALSQFTSNPRGVGQMYDEALALQRADMVKAQEEAPVASLGAEIGTGILTGGAMANLAKQGVAKASPQAASALSRYIAANPKKAGAIIGAGTGGLYGAGVGEGDNRLDTAAQGAIFGAPFGFAGGALGQFLSRRGTMGVPNSATGAADDVGAPSMNMLKQGLKGADLGDAQGVLSPEQLQRAQELSSVGVTRPTAAMLSRDPRTWQFERNTAGIAGVGDDIRQRYVESNEAIKDALKSLGKSFGGKASTPYEAGESIAEAVTAKNKEMQKAVGDLYGRIRGENLLTKGFKPNRILDALDEASDNAYADNIVNSLSRKMKRYGLLDGKGQYQEGQALSVSQAEELRKFANSLRGDKQTDHIVGNIIDALDDDVIETAGSDAFKAARDAARNRFREFESKILGGLAEGKIVSDDVLKKTVYGGKVKDVQALKESLLSGTGEQVARGRQAWNDLKLQTLNDIMDKATSGGGKLSGTSLKRQLDKIGKERLETVFDPHELMKLKTIEKAAEYTTIEVPESFVNYSGTGAANVNNALSGVLQTSGLGNFMESAGGALARLPFGMNIPGSVVGTPLRAGGKLMQDTAQKQSVRNVLNPYGSALGRFTNPNAVGKGGVYGGVLGKQFINEEQ